VPSQSTADAKKRVAIRQTWFQYLNQTVVNCTMCQNRTVKLLFIVGSLEKNEDDTELKEEAQDFGDLGVLPDFTETQSAKNEAEMTQRSIRYALEHFKFKLLLKVDTTSWVFMDRLVYWLGVQHMFDSDAGRLGIYAGDFSHDGSATVPVHAHGGGYALSPDLCEFIAGMGAASEDVSGAPKWGDEYGWAPVPRLVNLPQEDASVGFWLQAVNHTKVSMPVSFGKVACPSTDDGKFVIDHGVSPSAMEQRWTSFMRNGHFCERRFLDPAQAAVQGEPVKVRHHLHKVDHTPAAAIQGEEGKK